MPTDLQPLSAPPEFAEVLTSLRSLTRDFLLGFRLQVGKLILDRFYGGDLTAYRSTDPSKTNSFNRFSETCAADLAELGLSVNVLRQCVNARATYDMLPQEVRESLQFTHVVELARVADASQRARLAMDATRQGWKVDQIKDAVSKVNAGRYFDTDPSAAGTQPPPDPPDSTPAPRKAGRVLVQFDRTLRDIHSLCMDLQATAPSQVTAAHRRHAHAVLVDLKARVAELEKVVTGLQKSAAAPSRSP